MKLRLLALLLLTLAGCALPPPAPVRTDAQTLLQKFGTLPGARVTAADPLAVSYPGETLFGSGAALPLAGGTAVLDPLAQLIGAYPELVWSGTVRATGGASAGDDGRLAAARARLLTRYFRHRGIGEGRLTLVPAAGAGAPLALQARYAPASSATSAGEKR